MGSWAGKIILRFFTVLTCVVAVTWLALWYFIPAPPHELTIIAGLKGGAFEHIAERYKERLAQQHVTLNLRFVERPAEFVSLINDPKSGASATFMFAGQTNATESPDVLSLGRIDAAPLWIFYRGAEPLDRLSQLKGKRVYVTSATGDFMSRILAANGIRPDDIVRAQLVGVQPAAKALLNGEVDVIMLPPIDLYAPSIQTMLRDPSVRLMNVTQAEALTRLFPSLNRLVLPQGVIDLEKNVPPADVSLIGSTSSVVVRKELHPELVYLLAQTLKEVHSGGGIFQRAGEFPTQTDPEFPVAEEALDYYRNGPSMMQRYLPFWMINYAKRAAAILVTVVAIIIPIFSYAPRLYAWFMHVYAEKLYGRLRVIEASLKSDLTFSEIETLKSDLESVSRAAHILPMRRSSLFFDLIMHIDLTRTRLASRLVTLRGQAA